MRRTALLLAVLPLLSSCEAYWVHCPDWDGPAVVVLVRGRFYNLRGRHVDSSMPEQCTYTELAPSR